MSSRWRMVYFVSESHTFVSSRCTWCLSEARSSVAGPFATLRARVKATLS